MFTDKRLTKAYENAQVEYFDENSKYFFLSDLHRGDGSFSDEFVKNNNIAYHAMNHYYEDGYTYVEVGDGDELWEHKQFKHIRFAHKDMFSTLNKFFLDNRLIMLYGNHNIFLRNTEYLKNNYYTCFDEYTQSVCDLFPGIIIHEALVLKNKRTNQEILTVHGHQGDLMNDQLYIINLFLVRFFWKFIHVIGFQNPSSPAKNQFKRRKIENTYLKWIQKDKKMLICGHTHIPRFPDKDGLPYFNTGCCIETRGLISLEIANEMITMVNWRVRPNQDGVMVVERKVVRDSVPIESFNFQNPKED